MVVYILFALVTTALWFLLRKDEKPLLARPSPAYLVLRDAESRPILITGSPFYIDRRDHQVTNHLNLTHDRQVHRNQHAVLSIQGGKWTVHDISSHNGIYVNGSRVMTKELCSGDILRIGQTEIEFRHPSGPQLAAIEKDDRTGTIHIVQRVGGNSSEAEVYQATTAKHGTVALKIPRLEGNVEPDELVRRFLRQSELHSSFDHPNIVKVLGQGTWTDERPYLLLEFCEEGRLRQHMRTGLCVEEHHVRSLAIQLLDALGCVHQARFVHLDIKPENILVERSGTIKLTDFGIAQKIGTCSDGGTSWYMAPEQFLNRPLRETADLYAVGCLLYELLTSRCPFEGDREAIRHGHLSLPPTPPRQLNPAISLQMESIVLHLLEKNPDDRPQCAAIVKNWLTKEQGSR
jgi:pSer/pThr/pTyr-binding forkhead associated (FHA) protein